MPMPDQKPLQKQDGGFMMRDKVISTGDETLYSIMEKHFNKPGGNKPFFNSVLQQKEKAPNRPIAFLDSADYKEIYNKLIGIIMTDAVYTQTFEYTDGTPTYKREGMHNYHIQLCALMTMSFLFELEAFSVVHNYIPINIDGAKNNMLPTTFSHDESTPDLRYYNKLITGGVDAMLKYFTDSLDIFFNEFMKKLLDEILRLVNYHSIILTREEILEAIVPLKSREPLHVPNTFDYIYVTWKERIKQKIKENIKAMGRPYIDATDDKSVHTDDKYYSICINMAIEGALNQLENSDSKYIAEGTGFFSFLYLLPKPGVKEVYNGSCITYSMLELYIMARLHVHANRLTLNMESEIAPIPHRYWKSIQDEDKAYINLPSVTHWATQYEFQSLALYFRSIPRFRGKITTKHLFNFVDPDKPKLCLLLLYPIFDSYIRYIDQPSILKKESKKESAHIDKILPFIRNRIEFVKQLFKNPAMSKEVKIEYEKRGHPIIPPKEETTVTVGWFKTVFGVDEPPLLKDIKKSFQVKKSGTNNHILLTVTGGKPKGEIDVGVFRYMSVKQLLDAASANTNAMSVFGFDQTKNLKCYTVESTARAIHTNPTYHSSIFQVASQFNALEMENPARTPQDGITIYHTDRTQGPACAMVCPFGTLYRNYFCMPSASTNDQPADKSVHDNPQIGPKSGGPTNNIQINTLTKLRDVDGCFKDLIFQNGYIFVNDKAQLTAINTYLSTPENFWNAVMAINYVIQEDTPVVDLDDGTILSQIVSQIYCSAYPVAYSTKPPTMSSTFGGVSDTKKQDYELLSCMILHAVYYSTLAYAVSRITPDETRKKVFLTRVGGGAFENDNYLIDTAIHNAVLHFIAYPIDVYIVTYDKSGTAPKEVDNSKLESAIVTTTPNPSFVSDSSYINIRKMLDEKAKAETSKVKKATDEMVTLGKEEETKLRSSLTKSTGKKEKLDDEAKAKAKAEKAKKKEEDRIHEEKTKKKHLNLTQAIDEAIKTFSEKLTAGGGDDKKYANILDDLMTEINKDREVRDKADAEADAKSKTGKKTGKKTESEPAGNDTDAILKRDPGVKSNGPRSLANIGQMCYMNAALQLIYSMDEFKNSVLSMADNNPLKDYLEEIAKGVDASAEKLATALHEFSDITTKTRRPFNSQEDSSELLLSVLQNDIFTPAKALVNFTTIESVHTTTTLDPDRGACKAETGVVSHLQYATMPVPDSIKDSIIYIPNVAAQPLFIFNLPVTTTDADFNKMIQKITPMDTKAVAVTDFLTGTACSRINKATISTQTVIIPGNTQRYFIVSLNRFNDAGDKIKTPIKLTGAEITLGTIKFGIKGCISHHGSTPKGGHYTYVEFIGGKPTTVYDDHNIVKYDDYVKVLPERNVDTEGYVLLFERK